MMCARFNSLRGQSNPLGAMFTVVVLSLPLQAFAGIAPIPDSAASQPVNSEAQFQIDAATSTVSPIAPADTTLPLMLPAPANDRVVALNIEPRANVQISIPDLPIDLVPAANASNNSASAIPLPPAIQSGITGIVALALGAGIKRFRRAFR